MSSPTNYDAIKQDDGFYLFTFPDIDEDEFMKMTRNVSKVREKNNNQHYLNQGTIDYNPYPENYDIDDEEDGPAKFVVMR